MRKIIHIDMDAFYASIEQRDHLEYRGKPLAVGYSGNRGVVAAASYEARRYGVKSAMSSKIAQRKCPNLIFVRARFDVYKSVSKQIMNIFLEYTDLVEPLSLDEAFLDVTNNHKNILLATDVAQKIRKRIWNETGLTASAGVSFNKFLAKIASDYNKPNGLFVITPKRAEKFVEMLPIERFFGVGKVTAARMHQMGIRTGADLKNRTENELIEAFGKMGRIYFLNAKGIDERMVNPDRIRKSIGAENTFQNDTDSLEVLSQALEEVAFDVMERIKKSGFTGRTVTLKIKYADFRIKTKSKTVLSCVDSFEMLYAIGMELLQDIETSPSIRLLGLSIKNSIDLSQDEGGAIQLSFEFDGYA